MWICGKPNKTPTIRAWFTLPIDGHIMFIAWFSTSLS